MRYLLLTLLTSLSVWAMTAQELASKMEKKVSGFKSSVSTLKMLLISANGDSVTRKLELKTLEKGSDSKVLIEFLSPNDVKGTKMLTYVNANKDNDQWLYLPAIKRVKRLVGSSKKGNFMGSEFAYEDFGRQGDDAFTYDEALSEVVIDGVACFKGRRYPKDGESIYSYQDFYVDKESFLLKQVDYYDVHKRLFKKAHFSDYKQSKGLFRVGKIEMNNLQNSKSTHLIWQKDEIFANLKPNDFHKRVLSR